MEFDTLPEFDKDLNSKQGLSKKTLLRKKKYRTLNDDLKEVKTILRMKPGERPPFSFRIDNLGLETCIIKVKKIAWKALKGSGVNSGFRLIYAYNQVEEKIIFIELYHKNNKENEDRQRINDNYN
jgi:hypothetical protein